MNMQAVIVMNEAELLEFIHKETDSRRVVPTILASVSWLIFGMIGSDLVSFPKWANSSSIRARRFSLELKS